VGQPYKASEEVALYGFLQDEVKCLSGFLKLLGNDPAGWKSSYATMYAFAGAMRPDCFAYRKSKLFLSDHVDASPPILQGRQRALGRDWFLY